MEDKKYTLSVRKNAFDATTYSELIRDVEEKDYSKEVKILNGYSEVLERYGDYDSLLIPTDQYLKGEDWAESDCGIEFKDQDDGAFYRHQTRAALEFLRDKDGFGLLADVVGSGKTYEAGLVVSELAARNRVRSILFIVPSQAISDWIDVIGKQFGLGTNALYYVEDQKDEDGTVMRVGVPNRKALAIQRIGDYQVPRVPVILTYEQFVKWGKDCLNLLFDVIVVDEAHHLSDEEETYSDAMKYLSKLVELKKEAGRSQCLLLSATPHKGNLSKMFRLWYFIISKGGHAENFIGSDDRGERTPDYLDLKQKYNKVVCKGAATVMEFVMTAKKELMQHPLYREAFQKFLTERSLKKQYDEGTLTEKDRIISDYLKENEQIEKQIELYVARQYHGGVLGSIMIRHADQDRAFKKKRAVNLLFFPTKKQYEHRLKIRYHDRDLTVDVDHFNDDRAIEYEGEFYSIDRYVKEHGGSVGIQQAAGEIFRLTVAGIDNVDDDPAGNPFFCKKGTLQFYSEMMMNMPAEVENRLYVVGGTEEDPFEHKYAAFTALLDKHADQRVIVFFDYTLKDKKSVVEKFVERIKRSKYKTRFLNGCVGMKKEVEAVFNKKEDALLVVTDPSFTESVNLQKASIVVNFQVVTDPVAMDQRIGRAFRIGQKNDVIIYNLADMDQLEGYALMYLSRIKLLTTNSGDATILAGSNSDMMVAVSCKRCKKVKLIPESEYEKKKDTAEMLCDNVRSPDCKLFKEHFTLIVHNDFRCDKCSVTMSRSNDTGFECVGVPAFGNPKSLLMQRAKNAGNFAGGDRKYECSKECAMLNCARLRELDCNVVKALKAKPNETASNLDMLCAKCTKKEECYPKCRLSAGIDGCTECGYAKCSTKPHKLQFDENWVADCPSCGDTKRGKLRRVEPSSFADYVQCSWDFEDGGESFCDVLRREAGKVAKISRILDLSVDYDKREANR